MIDMDIDYAHSVTAAICGLSEKGWSVYEIAKEFGLTEAQVAATLKERADRLEQLSR